MTKGLKFFTRTSGDGVYNIVFYHSPHSLTWSWGLSFTWTIGNKQVRPVFGRWKDNNGWQLFARVPFVGIFRWHRQQPMYYKDVYRREIARLDEIKSQLRAENHHLHEVAEAALDSRGAVKQ